MTPLPSVHVFDEYIRLIQAMLNRISTITMLFSFIAIFGFVDLFGQKQDISYELSQLSDASTEEQYYDGSKGNSNALMSSKTKVQAVIGFPLIVLMGVYQHIISPQLSTGCQFALTCSNFSKQAFTEFGIAKGTFLTLDRLYRCNAFTSKAYGHQHRDEEGKLKEHICEHY